MKEQISKRRQNTVQFNSVRTAILISYDEIIKLIKDVHLFAPLGPRLVSQGAKRRTIPLHCQWLFWQLQAHFVLKCLDRREGIRIE
jgi:hypothetical protein